jgi:hypothetical protein
MVKPASTAPKTTMKPTITSIFVPQYRSINQGVFSAEGG